MTEKEKPGPTGEYPNGKLNSNDSGELNMAIGAIDGLVVVDYGGRVKWIAMHPDQARLYAQALLKRADQADEQLREARKEAN